MARETVHLELDVLVPAGTRPGRVATEVSRALNENSEDGVLPAEWVIGPVLLTRQDR